MKLYAKKRQIDFGFGRKPQKNFWQKVVPVFLFLSLFIVLLNLFEPQIKNYFYSATSPFSKVFWQAGSGSAGFFSSIINSSEILRQNQKLKQENERLLLRLLLIEKEIEKNQSLTEFLENTKKDGLKTLQASVVSIDIFEDFILIDKGKKDGVLENMPVISSQKAVFGKVVESFDNFSKVMLISHKNSALDVKVIAEAEYSQALPKNNKENGGQVKATIYGSVKGSGNLSVYLDLVPLDSQIQQGDVLLTSVLGKVFPKDFLVGRVISKSKDDLKPFVQATVEPFFDINNTENLFVILDYPVK